MPDPTLPVNVPADAAADLRARYGRDVVDRAHEAIMADEPDLDGAAYDVALAAACDKVVAIDAAADLAEPWRRR